MRLKIFSGFVVHPVKGAGRLDTGFALLGDRYVNSATRLNFVECLDTGFAPLGDRCMEKPNVRERQLIVQQ